MRWDIKRPFFDFWLEIAPAIRQILRTTGQNGAFVAGVQALIRAASVLETEPRLDLTCREVEMLECFQRGSSNKVIARRLDISESTVKFHVKNLFRKLGVHRRDAALDEARRRALLSGISS
jgi:DNA-binding NarL/FixJ family response regulator